MFWAGTVASHGAVAPAWAAAGTLLASSIVGPTDMALPHPMTEGWSDGPWPEGMYIALGMDYNFLLISFWEQLLVL